MIAAWVKMETRLVELTSANIYSLLRTAALTFSLPIDHGPAPLAGVSVSIKTSATVAELGRGDRIAAAAQILLRIE